MTPGSHSENQGKEPCHLQHLTSKITLELLPDITVECYFLSSASSLHRATG
jgi:hypothetical protein